jgi:hypothetical protein
MKSRTSSFVLTMTMTMTMTLALTLSLILLTSCSDASGTIKFLNGFQDKAKRPSQAATATGTIGTASVRVDYSQPAKNGREIFGALVPYGKVWRTGANEATEITFDKDVMVAGKPLKAGRYQLFTIPQADKWTVIFNSKLGQWGAFFYDEKSNVLTVDVPSAKSETVVEKMVIGVETAPVAGLSVAWDKTRVLVPVSAP